MITISTFEPLYQFVILSLVIIAIVRILKCKGIFDDSYQPVFDKLVTELALPAVIFSVFATSSFSYDAILPACILFVTLIASLFLAYCICRFLRLPHKTTGTIIMVSGFGSTATMAGPLLSDLYNLHGILLDQGILTGIIGVAFPFFTIGVLIASYFGTKEERREISIPNILKEFLVTPIFISFVFGIICTFLLYQLDIQGGNIFQDIFTHFFSIINQSMELLILIAIGLMLHKISLRFFLPLLGVVIFIKLIFEPFFAAACSMLIGIPVISQQLLFLEAAVPSGAIASVLASRYGCDGSLAGWMVIGTYLFSLISIPIGFYLFPI